MSHLKQRASKTAAKNNKGMSTPGGTAQLRWCFHEFSSALLYLWLWNSYKLLQMGLEDL